jgi:hypothetical protein
LESDNFAVNVDWRASSTPSSSVSSPASFAASLPVSTLTSSLLIYLAYKAGLDRRTGETAEHLISFHARSSAATVIH